MYKDCFYMHSEIKILNHTFLSLFPYTFVISCRERSLLIFLLYDYSGTE